MTLDIAEIKDNDPELYRRTLEFSQATLQDFWQSTQRLDFFWNELFDNESGMRLQGYRKNSADWSFAIGDTVVRMCVAGQFADEQVKLDRADITVKLLSELADCNEDDPDVGYCRIGTKHGRIDTALGDIAILKRLTGTTTGETLYAYLLAASKEIDPFIRDREASYTIPASRDRGPSVSIKAYTEYAIFGDDCVIGESLDITSGIGIKFATELGQTKSPGVSEVSGRIKSIEYSDSRCSEQQVYTLLEAEAVAQIGRQAIDYPLQCLASLNR